MRTDKGNWLIQGSVSDIARKSLAKLKGLKMSDDRDCANSEHCGNIHRDGSTLCGPCADDALDEGRMSLMHIDESNGPIERGSYVKRSELDAVVLCEKGDARGVVEMFGRPSGTVWVEWLRYEEPPVAKSYTLTASNSQSTRDPVSFDTLIEAQAAMAEVLQSTTPRWSKVGLTYCGGRVTSVERSEDPEQFTDA